MCLKPVWTCLHSAMSVWLNFSFWQALAQQQLRPSTIPANGYHNTWTTNFKNTPPPLCPIPAVVGGLASNSAARYVASATSNPAAAPATAPEHFRRPRSATGTSSSRIFCPSQPTQPQSVLFAFGILTQLCHLRAMLISTTVQSLMWHNMCERLLDLSIIAFDFREIENPTWKLVNGLFQRFQSLHPDPPQTFSPISPREEPSNKSDSTSGFNHLRVFILCLKGVSAAPIRIDSLLSARYFVGLRDSQRTIRKVLIQAESSKLILSTVTGIDR